MYNFNVVVANFSENFLGLSLNIAENAVYLRAFNEKFRSFSVERSEQKCNFFTKKNILEFIYYVLEISNPVFLCNEQKTKPKNNNNTKIANLYAYYYL